MQALIITQYMENYGTEKDPFWKFKGDDEYLVEFSNDLNIDEVVTSIRSKIEYSNPMAREYIINYILVEDDYMTEFERSQLEYEGSIQFPAKRFVFEQEEVLVNSNDEVI